MSRTEDKELMARREAIASRFLAAWCSAPNAEGRKMESYVRLAVKATDLLLEELAK